MARFYMLTNHIKNAQMDLKRKDNITNKTEKPELKSVNIRK